MRRISNFKPLLDCASPVMPRGVEHLTQDGAEVFSMQWQSTRAPEEAMRLLTEEIDMLTVRLEESGGMAGHIKAAVSEKTIRWVLSAAGTPCNVTAHSGSSVLIDLTAIVFTEDPVAFAEEFRALRERI
ncbi:MAG: hypothetical protein LIO67_00025 [Lachnospiraceae bacterium]|nr:hypothetical protein [Lachnospiraceae bacterium]